MNFSFISAAGRLKHIALTLAATPVRDEILWLASELGGAEKQPNQHLTHQAHQHPQQQQQQRQQQQQQHHAPRAPGGQTPDIKRAGKAAAEPVSAPATPTAMRAAHAAAAQPQSAPGTDPMERKLVKVPIRKKKPWDQNLVKFSLKKARKRSKRGSSKIAAVVSAAAEAEAEGDEQEIDAGGADESASVSTESPTPARAAHS